MLLKVNLYMVSSEFWICILNNRAGNKTINIRWQKKFDIYGIEI